jgi:hypothetical protein
MKNCFLLTNANNLKKKIRLKNENRLANINDPTISTELCLFSEFNDV